MRCKIFNCDKRHGHYCCAECPRRSRCKNPCQNSPGNCGQARPETVHELMKEHGIRRVDLKEAISIINKRKPVGLFFSGSFREGYTGIDNRPGDAGTEEFQCLHSCVEWLIGKAPREEYGP